MWSFAAIASGWQISFNEHSLQRLSFTGDGNLSDCNSARIAKTASSTWRRNASVIWTSRRRLDEW